MRGRTVARSVARYTVSAQRQMVSGTRGIRPACDGTETRSRGPYLIRPARDPPGVRAARARCRGVRPCGPPWPSAHAPGREVSLTGVPREIMAHTVRPRAPDAGPQRPGAPRAGPVQGADEGSGASRGPCFRRSAGTPAAHRSRPGSRSDTPIEDRSHGVSVTSSRRVSCRLGVPLPLRARGSRRAQLRQLGSMRSGAAAGKVRDD
jgi:hypothetical protein